MYAIVDIETTGNFTGRSKITEVAVYQTDGKRITNTYHSLVNPETNIPPYIEGLTGISNQMVENAPKFFEIAKELYQILDGCIFVAHNVNFDYGFIRQEFKSLGGDFQTKKLCTVRLARKIIPGLPSYSLGNLAKSLDIPINGRHRANGDAEATVKIFQLLLEKDQNGYIEQSLKRNSMEALLPPNLPKEQFENLPENTGVYYFFDQTGKVIYVGKAKNIKNRIRGHFSSGSDTIKKQNLFRDIYGINYELCGNELIAMLYETHEIQRLWPAYNRMQKRVSWNYGIFQYEDRHGYKRFSISRLVKGGTPLLVFISLADARSFIKNKVAEYDLCPKLAGLQKSRGPCFDYQIKQCSGACNGDEPPFRYNKKVNKAIQSFVQDERSIAIIGQGRNHEESSVVWVENGKYLGFGFFNSDMEILHNSQLKEFIKSFPDNQDIQRILKMYRTYHRDYRIIPIE